MAKCCQINRRDNGENEDYNYNLIQPIEVSETCSQVADG